MRLTIFLLLISLLTLAPQTRGQTNQRLTEAQLALLELNTQGVIHATAHQYEEAVALIDEAIRREPRLAGLYKNLGVTYINWGRPADALEPLRKALELEPDCGQSHFYLGVAYSQLARHKDASRHYEVAVQHEWGNADSYSNLGSSYYLMGQPKKALMALKRAANLAPSDYKILNNLAVVLARLNRYDEAAEKLLQVLLLQPELALARYNLGWVYVVQNNRAAALEQYRILKTQAPKLGNDLYKRIYSDFLVTIER